MRKLAFFICIFCVSSSLAINNFNCPLISSAKSEKCENGTLGDITQVKEKIDQTLGYEFLLALGERTLDSIDKNIEKMNRGVKCYRDMETESTCNEFRKFVSKKISENRPKIRLELALSGSDEKVQNEDNALEVQQKISTFFNFRGSLIMPKMERLSVAEQQYAIEKYDQEQASIDENCRLDLLVNKKNYLNHGFDYLPSAELEFEMACKISKREKIRNLHKDQYNAILSEMPLLAYLQTPNPKDSQIVEAFENLIKAAKKDRNGYNDALTKIMSMKGENRPPSSISHNDLKILMSSPLVLDLVKERPEFCSIAQSYAKDVQIGELWRTVGFVGLAIATCSTGIIVGGMAGGVAGGLISGASIMATGGYAVRDSWLRYFDQKDKALSHFEGKQMGDVAKAGEQKQSAIFDTALLALDLSAAKATYSNIRAQTKQIIPPLKTNSNEFSKPEAATRVKQSVIDEVYQTDKFRSFDDVINGEIKYKNLVDSFESPEAQHKAQQLLKLIMFRNRNLIVKDQEVISEFRRLTVSCGN